MNLSHRVTAAEFVKAQQQVRKRSKYGNRKVEIAGEKFDSQGEADEWQNLKLREAAGEIWELRRQVRFHLFGFGGEALLSDSGRHLMYVADYVYMREVAGKEVREVGDFKGKDTRESALKRSILAAMHKRRVIVTRKATKSSRHPRKRAA